MTVKALFLTASCAVAFIGSPAFASVAIAPETFYEVRVGDVLTDTNQPGSYSSLHASATTQASPMPTLMTEVAVGDAQDAATAYMRYYYRINGPDGLVPVSLAGFIRLTAQAGDTAQANSAGQVDLPTVFTSDSASIEIDRGGTVVGSVSELTFNLHGTVYANGWNQVILRALSGARGSRYDSGRGTALVDPILSIDPSFFTGPGAPDPNRYSLSFSNGVGNGAPSALPEPASWALMIAGFGAIGGTLRRQRGGLGVAEKTELV